MTDNKLDDSILRGFTGTEQWYRHALNRAVLFTDGAKYVADAAGAYWLLDEIALAQAHVAAVKGEDIQVWKLTVHADSTAELACEDGNYNTVFTKLIPFTDFPPPGITLWFANDVIYLPSEH